MKKSCQNHAVNLFTKSIHEFEANATEKEPNSKYIHRIENMEKMRD